MRTVLGDDHKDLLRPVIVEDICAIQMTDYGESIRDSCAAFDYNFFRFCGSDVGWLAEEMSKSGTSSLFPYEARSQLGILERSRLARF